jgi:hypothetical protein
VIFDDGAQALLASQRVGRISDSVIRRMMFIYIRRNTAIAYCALLAFTFR